MKFKLTKKQNVVLDGVKYKAVAHTSTGHACRQCALDQEVDACVLTPCQAHHRADGREVIFIRKA